MAGNAFTAGVKPGGLTTTTEIRILLCWLAAHSKTPVTFQELEDALVGESLVNYFELAAALGSLCDIGLLREEDGGYTALPAGVEVARTLERDVPRSVRDTAERALTRGRRMARLRAQHPVRIVPAKGASGFLVEGALRDIGSDVFTFSLYVPDEASAHTVCERFVENGDTIYSMMLSELTGCELPPISE